MWGSQICIKGPCTLGCPQWKNFDTLFPQLLAYTYITVKFRFVAPLMCDLRTAPCIIAFALKGPPKWGFGLILGVGAKIFGGKVHPSSELHFFRHLWSRSDESCSSIRHGYSHLPQVNILASLGVHSSPTRSRRKTPLPEAPLWTFDYSRVILPVLDHIGPDSTIQGILFTTKHVIYQVKVSFRDLLVCWHFPVLT